ncbi:MAG: cobalt-precorrin 5A hydrolase [Firmicutes bacterium HGW-Firmicutes-7]|nr:MAG: cobalt-precorrin 5A hydrolase [Firmicutes bacterium HGW-Firmicutes-7]
MRLAIITLTSGGVFTAKRLKRIMPDATLYTLNKHVEDGFLEIQPSLHELVGKLFKTYEGIVFIMATGIVVRTIAPFIQHKTVDPAIMVMDEKGAFVISLLSGHIGRANEWTIEIASQLRAMPVITTASDVNGKMAVDTLAELLGCSIQNMEQAKRITARIIENEKIGVLSDLPLVTSLYTQFTMLEGDVNQERLDGEEIKGLIIISKENPKTFNIPQVWLTPKDLVVGIGCKRGKTKEELMEALYGAFKTCGVSMKRLNKLVTVDIKKDEIGLLELVKELKVPLECVPRQAIRAIEEQFEGSEFVEKTLGIKSVSEPCGYIGSGQGKCLLPKQKLAGITISIWEKCVQQEEI